MDSVVKEIVQIVKECGKLIVNAKRDHMEIDSKNGPANFVTEYDKKVQDLLEEKLKKAVPDAYFVGEEDDKNIFSEQGKCFIVDPIDGTTNFIKDYHMSCISVALTENGEVQTGVIYNPYLEEVFWAQRGEGAYLNDRRIHVSSQPLSNGIVLLGTSPYYAELHERTFELAFKYFKEALDIRRSGSAALDMCSIAAGRAELFFELRLSPWDYAAGSLIVEEAGGVVTTVDGNKITLNKPCSILAKNI